MRVDIDTVENDEAEVAEQTEGQPATEIDGPEQLSDAESAGDSETDLTSEQTRGGDGPTEDITTAEALSGRPRIKWSRVLAFGLLPLLVLSLGAGAGFLKWRDSWVRVSSVAGIESVAAAKESTVALLSYQPDSVDKDLRSASDRLTGKFKDSYLQLVRDVVIPGSKKDHIAAVATIPAAASVSATPDHAVALVYVDQMVTVGNDAPTDTTSAVRVTLDKSGERWLISAFDPI